MEQFYRKAYKVAAAISSSLLNVPVSPAGIKDGSSPAMANCLISADAAPLLIEKTTPLDVDGVELAPMSQSEIVKTNDNNEVSALHSNQATLLASCRGRAETCIVYCHLKHDRRVERPVGFTPILCC